MEKLGLIAGNGRFPFYVARCARDNGYEVHAVALKGEADPALADAVHTMAWSPVEKLGATIDLLVRAGVRRAVMAGQVKHRKLFHHLFLDATALKVLGRIADRRTDSILQGVADEFRVRDIILLPSTAFLRDYMPGPGIVGRERPTRAERAEIAFGFSAAKKLAAMDIGQTAVVRERCVVALEAVEGTDECILRAGALARRDAGEPSSIVVVKVAKPRQDSRFDVPVLGPGTVEAMGRVGGRVIAFEAGETLLLDRDEMRQAADDARICVVGVIAPPEARAQGDG